MGRRRRKQRKEPEEPNATTVIGDVGRYEGLETVHVTVIRENDGLGLKYDRTIRLAKGDAIENPPLNIREGDEFDLRIIRGFVGQVSRLGAQA